MPYSVMFCIITNYKDVEGRRYGLIQGAEKTHDVVSVPAEVRTGFVPNTIQYFPFQAT